MAVIVYKKTHFNPPDKISEASYTRFKALLSQDPGFQLIAEPVSFTSRFRRALKNFCWMAPLVLLLSLAFMLIFPNPVQTPDPVRISIFFVILIMGMIAVGLLMKLLLEGPSYATYLKNQRAYFYQMRLAIVNSPDYGSFMQEFYPGGRNRQVLPGEKASQGGKVSLSAAGDASAAGGPSAAKGSSIDRSLTELFYFIDKYWWIFFLLAAAIFFGRKLFK